MRSMSVALRRAGSDETEPLGVAIFGMMASCMSREGGEGIPDKNVAKSVLTSCRAGAKIESLLR